MTPLVRVTVVLAGLFVAASLVAGIFGGSPWTGMLIPVAAVIGPYMGLTYPLDPSTKMMLVAALVAAVVLTIGGLRYRARTLGQAAIVLGVVLWTSAGILGLSTGT